jgi:peptidoglycan hydrolase FlgJ
MSDSLTVNAVNVKNLSSIRNIGRLPSSSEKLKISSEENDEGRLKKSCMDLESVFVSQLLKEMRAAIPKSDLMNGGNAEEIYTSMLDDQYAREIASSGNLGLGRAMFEQIRKKTSEIPVNVKE